jgi:hypothetical protein
MAPLLYRSTKRMGLLNRFEADDGSIVLRPARRKYELSELVSGITSNEPSSGNELGTTAR